LELFERKSTILSENLGFMNENCADTFNEIFWDFSERKSTILSENFCIFERKLIFLMKFWVF
jgi:hypothetical protein